MRPSSWLHLAMALSAVASLSSCNCQRRGATETPIAELQPCAEDERCETGLCDSANGKPKVCLRTCTQGCRGADLCTPLADARYACVPEKAGLCKACERDSDCPQVADRCLVLGASRYCGRDCGFDDSCPPSFRCGEATTTTGAVVAKQCQPNSGTCDCIAATAGQQVPCDVTNTSGTCTGIKVCRPPAGYDTCSARTPTTEVCNGVDDDCNGMTDENLGDLTCGVGECVRASAACVNGSRQRCTPGLPSAELCNNRDDNCDGTVDDGFNLMSNVANCGSCGRVCVLTNAVPKCELGACAVERCTPGWTDLDRVAANGCEYPCVNSDGGVEICDGLDNDCDGVVDNGFNLLSDPTNCGQCNLVCSVTGNTVSTYACVARVCGIGTCTAGRGNCNQQYGDGCEVNLNIDTNNCNACGSACVVPNGTPSCVGGSCGVAACNSGFADCNGLAADGCEVNTQASVSSCGACGSTCNAANANNTCLNGTCAFSCTANWWNADGQAANGCEYACVRTAGGVEACDNIDNDCNNRIDETFNLTSDPLNCGVCSRVCSAAFATTNCSASNCGISSCTAGHANCNGQYADGCEVSTATDLANCGGCNNVCAPARATPSCAAGLCGVQSCNSGFANCNTQVSDGCEVNTNSDLANCGGCNASCTVANGTPQCLGGTCGVLGCTAPFANCNALASDGCETNTTNSLVNCGACNVVCATPNGTPNCSAGSCGISSCNLGYTNCNNLPIDGCEVSTGGNDLNNCGGCATVCATANATPRCTSGACSILSCNAGFANCNGLVSDGCEMNTTNNVSNCAACGTACSLPNANPVCTSSTCQVQSCLSTFRDCDGAPGNGCEVNVNANVDDCGLCGNLCPARANASRTCAGISCGYTCTAGSVDLDGVASNGCEYACTPTGVDDPDDASLDADCDGIDGSVVKGIFVATSGIDLNPGTRTQPKRTVQAGINAASAVQPHVYVSEGLYDEAITLRSGVSVFGGYSQANNWGRNASYVVTLRNGIVSGGKIVAVSGTALVAPTTVAYVTIQALDTVFAGASVYGLYCSGCTALTLRTTLVIAGSAGAGTSGSAGATGANGTSGLGGTNGTCDNNIPGAAGGAGGLSSCGTTGGAGGRGGNFGSNAGIAGSSGIVGTPGGAAGGGGDPGRPGNPGAAGGAGSNGSLGGGGAGGSVGSGYFVATSGGNGAGGTDGNGGGGGGGGGGQGCTFCNDGNGNGAGGGGGGGCAGGGASGGIAGGSSFGVFLLNSSGSVMLADTVISGSGGAGGAGGLAGSGGIGGARGIGATFCTGEIGAGGNGGVGGGGGNGGHGGGGAGGVSFAVYRVSSAVIVTGNTLTAGSGGFGGPSSGNAGSNGASGTVF